jgi:hypothetical protein
VWKIVWIDGCCIDIGIFICGTGLLCILSRCQTSIFFGFDGEKGVEWIIVVVEFDAITVEALYIKQAAVKEFELISRMFCALRETYDE